MNTPAAAPARPLVKPLYVGLFLEPALPPHADLEDDDDTDDEETP